MTVATVCLLAAFRILTPSDASSLKVGALENNGKSFISFLEGYDAVAGEEIPKPNLLLTWRKLNIPVYAKVAYDPEGSAEFFRKKCAFIPFAAGADGVLLTTDPAKMAPGWQAALTAARDDVRLAQRLDDLAAKCKASSNYKLVLEGRRIGNFFAETPFVREDVDVIRLEIIALIRHLETLLGEKVSQDDVTPLKTEPNTLPFVPCQGREAKIVRVEGFGKTAKLCEGVSLSASAGGMTLRLEDRKAKWNGAGLPAGADTFRAQLYLPVRTGEGWERHDIVLTAPRKPTPRADSYCTDVLAIGIEERFRDCNHRVYEVPNRTWSENYAKLHFGDRPYIPAVTDGKTSSGWALTCTISFSDLVGQWPFSENKRLNFWYLVLDRLPDGSAGQAFKLQFPRGNAKTFTAMCCAFNCFALTGIWGGDSGAVAWAYHSAEEDRLFPFEKSKVPHRYSREENDIFLKRMVAPVARRAGKTAETAYCERTTSPKYAKLNAAQKESFVKSSEAYRLYYPIVSRLRKEFLLMRFKGEMPPEPKADALAEEENKLKKPASLSADDEEVMSLDEEAL